MVVVGERDDNHLGLKFSDNGVAWWEADKLEFIKSDQMEMITTWKAQEKAKTRRLKSYDFLVQWAIKYPKTLPPRQAITFLWNIVRPGKSMWGSHGEGIAHWSNSMALGLLYINMERAFGKPVTKRNAKAYRKHMVKFMNSLKKG